ncbi:hypothetical protein [Caulobacter sp.]|uniref:hypothetical protein n=1 Tax=Caulobacter sp. TaxID=78 RepID=UPI002B4A193B|nr:hypothetical protein [Caulobacter sp.]HJV40038.1 hypothetical protein [Caulobacter sp.]
MTDVATNLIPAQFGSIVYASRWPDWAFFSGLDPAPVGQGIAFEADNFERLQRLFLTKPIHWSYEEGVRVAKSVHGMTQAGEHQTRSGAWTLKGDAQAEVQHFLRVPEQAFRELHFGIRSSVEASDELREAMTGRYPHLKWMECTLGLNSFDVQPVAHTTIAEALSFEHPT